jgi:hypothetical protein
MSSFDRVRLTALTLPRVEEGLHFGGPAFRVGGKTFALYWAKGARTIMKLRPDRQELLFEIRPDQFQPCRVGVGVWSFVELGLIEDQEVDDLVVEAWSTVAPAALRRASAGLSADKSKLCRGGQVVRCQPSRAP